ncbi:alpha/beta fold hydrolase [Shimia ponticola]|uniref:alpha/beta fold hydrolase n=1 Tax=Shimia ponticola TaxID=2582893 RepID=UPI00164CC555|nr:alpha/beta hydrolase [Shimia ponticola]
MKLLIVAGVLLAGYATVAVMSSRQEVRAEAEFPPEGAFVEVDGRQVHYVQAGSGPDVILLHGASGNTRDWTFSFVEELSANYRVTAFDRPGMGYTARIAGYGGPFDGDAESPQEQAAFLSAAAQQLGIENPIVVGQSFGGAVAYAWALDQPAAAVVSLAGVALPWPGELGLFYRVNGSSLGGALFPPMIAAFVPDSYVESTINGIFAPQDAPEGYAEHIGAPLSIRTKSFRANALQVNTLYPHIEEQSERYDELMLPIEIVHGDADTTVPLNVHSAPFSERVESANLTVLPGIGHMPQHVAEAESIAAIDRAASRAGLR